MSRGRVEGTKEKVFCNEGIHVHVGLDSMHWKVVD